MQKRTPIKGNPNFSVISDDRLKEYIDLAQQMIFAYKGVDEEKVRVLTEVWKQMSDEYTERLCNAPFVAPVESSDTVVHKIKPIKRIKRLK